MAEPQTPQIDFTQPPPLIDFTQPPPGLGMTGGSLSVGSSVPNARIRNLPNPAANETSPLGALYHGAKTGAQLASLPMSAELPSMGLKQVLGMLAGGTVGKLGGEKAAESLGAGDLGKEAAGDIGAMWGGNLGAKLAENPVAQAIVKTAFKIGDAAAFGRLSKIWDAFTSLPAEVRTLSPKAIPVPPAASAPPAAAASAAPIPAAAAPPAASGNISPEGWYYLGQLQQIARQIEAEDAATVQPKNITPARAANMTKAATPPKSTDDLTPVLNEMLKRVQAAKGKISDLR